MASQPFTIETRAGIVSLTLDTPACAVNILTQQAAVQLLGILGALDSNVRVIVIRSAKPESFINGASLMLGSAVAKPEDLPRLTATIRRAYDALGNLRIPTVAAMRGNCYGCGVEFALRCRYRIAGDSADAHLYMPEISDYLLIPTFGSTQRLPLLVGLESATDFLLWGQRWAAREALARGLLHGCFADSEFDVAVERVAADLARQGVSSLLREPRPPSSVDIHHFGDRTRARIRKLPPAYREVYSACYDLLESAAGRGVPPSAQDDEAEVLASGRSIVAPASKAAVAFFFVRQLCEQVSRDTSAAHRSVRVRCDMSAAGPRFFRAQLEKLRMRDTRFEDLEGDFSADDLRVIGYGGPNLESGAVAISDNVEVNAPSDRTDVTLYAPAWRHGLPFVEIACRRPSKHAQTAARVLAKGGVRVVVTQPGSSFVSNGLLRAYLWPQVRFLAAGGDPNDVAATLLGFGFSRLAGDWLADWDLERLACVLAEEDAGIVGRNGLLETLGELQTSRSESAEGVSSTTLRDAMLISLLAFAHRSLREGCVNHPSIVDVAARELIDFPVGHTSLCRYLSVERARELVRRETISVATCAELSGLKEYVQYGQDFYR